MQAVIESEECVERIACEIGGIARDAGNHHHHHLHLHHHHHQNNLKRIEVEKKEKNGVCAAAQAWEPPAHIFYHQLFSFKKLPSCRFSHFTILKKLPLSHFPVAGLDQNLVTAASYMVPTKYTKYAKQFASSRKCEKIKCGSF